MAEKVEKKVDTEKTATFKVSKKKNFTGFVHPETRRFITANKKGDFVVKASDEKAIAILEDAADLYEV